MLHLDLRLEKSIGNVREFQRKGCMICCMLLRHERDPAWKILYIASLSRRNVLHVHHITSLFTIATEIHLQ
jgi:hypothetical protein